MSNTFRLNKQKQYLIYGVGGDGLKLASIFEENKYQLLGFIDQRALELNTVKDKPVWRKDDLEKFVECAENIVIIITIKNVFEHTMIAQELAKKGFSQCVYKPLIILQGSKDSELEKVSKAHDSFVREGNIPDELELVKVSYEYKMTYKDTLMIREENGNVLVWMPSELLYNYREGIEYANISMPTFFPLVELYQLFMGEHHENAEKILNNFYRYSSEWAHRMGVEVTDSLKKSWLTSRYKVYVQMKSMCEYDFDYFFRHAPEVALGAKGKFHVVNSGRNRIAFLLAKGYSYVPVRITKEDYLKWINAQKFESIKELIEKKEIREIPTAIPHPYFKEMLINDIDYNKTICFPIGLVLVKKMYDMAQIEENGYVIVDSKKLSHLWKNYRILCFSDDGGTLSRYLDAMDFQVFRLPSEGALIDSIDEMFEQNISTVNSGIGYNWDMVIVNNDINKKVLEACIQNKVEQIVYITNDINELKRIEKYMTDREKIVLSESFCNSEMKYAVLWSRVC